MARFEWISRTRTKSVLICDRRRMTVKSNKDKDRITGISMLTGGIIWSSAMFFLFTIFFGKGTSSQEDLVTYLSIFICGFVSFLTGLGLLSVVPNMVLSVFMNIILCLFIAVILLLSGNTQSAAEMRMWAPFSLIYPSLIILPLIAGSSLAAYFLGKKQKKA